jgi:hypothetical protein
VPSLIDLWIFRFGMLLAQVASIFEWQGLPFLESQNPSKDALVCRKIVECSKGHVRDGFLARWEQQYLIQD